MRFPAVSHSPARILKYSCFCDDSYQPKLACRLLSQRQRVHSCEEEFSVYKLVPYVNPCDHAKPTNTLRRTLKHTYLRVCDQALLTQLLFGWWPGISHSSGVGNAFQMSPSACLGCVSDDKSFCARTKQAIYERSTKKNRS